ncbi:MAG: cytochrome-c peroxidase [Gemmatimonadaceae bacterium]
MNRNAPLPLAGRILAILSLAACSDLPASAPSLTAPELASVTSSASKGGAPNAEAALVRQLAAGRGITSLPTPPRVRPQLVRLGQALTFDPILSGNRDISCATCHFPTLGTGDGKSLSIGQGGSNVGPARSHPQGVFIARNAPPLFNLGAMKHLFWDGRVADNGAGGVSTPAGALVTPAMQHVFEFGPISALGMFPVTNRAEMRAGTGNELADIPDADMQAIWTGLMKRLGAIPEYRAMFENSYPGTKFEDMTFAHASNAIAGFIVDSYSLANSPWDQFLAGRDDALTPKQLEGAKTFLTLKCSICHSTATLSDDQFHNVAIAQIGPGQGNGVSLRDDFGRMNVSGDPNDIYKFRTTPLRNVAVTGPYGHDGSIVSLRRFVEHYSESDLKLTDFNPFEIEPALRNTLLVNAAPVIAGRDPIIVGVVLTDDLVDKLMDYMGALTDPAVKDLDKTIPQHLPSKLAVLRPH